MAVGLHLTSVHYWTTAGLVRGLNLSLVQKTKDFTLFLFFFFLFRGHSCVGVEELAELYGGLHVPMSVMDRRSSTDRWNLTQLLDMFSLPEATLFADISQVGWVWKMGAVTWMGCGFISRCGLYM